jgi:hypothetical protein
MAKIAMQNYFNNIYLKQQVKINQSNNDAVKTEQNNNKNREQK